jgi:hypothetical protein
MGMLLQSLIRTRMRLRSCAPNVWARHLRHPPQCPARGASSGMPRTRLSPAGRSMLTRLCPRRCVTRMFASCSRILCHGKSSRVGIALRRSGWLPLLSFRPRCGSATGSCECVILATCCMTCDVMVSALPHFVRFKGARTACASPVRASAWWSPALSTSGSVA